MKKLSTMLFASLVIGASGMAATADAGVLVANEDNTMFFRNFENLYDANGNYVAPTGVPGGRAPIVGDHLFGVIDIQTISVLGNDTFNSTSAPVNQISGVFAQRIEAVHPVGADPYDAAQTSFNHLVLGTPTIKVFGGVDVSAQLVGNEMFSFFRDIGGTAFSFGGTVATSVATAVNGPKWLSFGYTDGGNGFGDNNDTGYMYSHADLALTLDNFTGEAFGALDVIFQDPAEPPLGKTLNDPNEDELGSLIVGLLNQTYFTSEFEGNTDSVNLGGFSPWDFASNDPAHVAPVPEPSTMLLLGAGLLGLGAYARKRKSS